jgi:hypothetical protein
LGQNFHRTFFLLAGHMLPENPHSPMPKNTLLPTSPSLLFVRPLGGEKPPVNQHPFSR